MTTQGICNVISLKTMRSLFPVMYHNPEDSKGATFKAEMAKGTIEYKPCSKCLHYYNLSTTTQRATMCIQTVQQNLEGFSKGHIQCAIKVRKLQAMMRSPTKANSKGMLCGTLIDDCPVDIIDIQNVHTFFGSDLAGLRGWMVRRQSEQVTTDLVASHGTLCSFVSLLC